MDVETKMKITKIVNPTTEACIQADTKYETTENLTPGISNIKLMESFVHSYDLEVTRLKRKL